MIRQYRVNFLNAEALVLNQAEFDQLENKHATTDVIRLETPDRVVYLWLGTITNIVSENIEAESHVVTPPTPQQLRAEKDQEAANAPVTLDDQLANPEVAK